MRRPILRMQDGELQRRQHSFTARLSGDLTELQWLSDVSRRAGHFAVVADDECVIVMHDVGQPTAKEFEQAGISAGSCWTEQIAGTNGLAMALRHQQMLTVAGDEHYFSLLTPFMCTASPIFDQSDEVIGAVSIAAIDRRDIRDRSVAEHLLQMATSRIQARLFHEHYRDIVRTSVAPAHGGIDVHLNALVAVDTDGIVRGATRAAASVLGAKSVLQLIDRPIDTIVETSLDRLVGSFGEPIMAESTAGPLTLVLSLPKPKRISSYRLPEANPSTSAGQSVRFTLADFEGADAQQIAMMRRLRQLFCAGLPLQLRGEPGIGKLSLVKALHFDATLGRSPLITIDDSEISGGAMTTRGAHLLERVRACAEAGADMAPATLHLRDIAALPHDVQYQVARTLSDLQDLDGAGNERFGVRIIASSACRDDQRMIPELRSHLSGDVQTLVPLFRRRDLRQLIERVRDQIDENSKPISRGAMTALLGYRWPGNFRELRLVLRRALLLSLGSEIMLHDLPEALLSQGRKGNGSPRCPAPDAEAMLFRDALASTNWNVSEAARRCGVSRATLHRKIRAFGIQRPRAARLSLIQSIESRG